LNSWNQTANWSASPTLTPTGASVPTSADSVFFTSSATYSVGPSGVLGSCLDFTITAGTPVFNGAFTLNIYGSLSFYTGISFTIFNSSTATINFRATSAATISTDNISLRFTIVFDGVGGSWKLLTDFYQTVNTNGVTLTNGTLDLNNKTLLCNRFRSDNSNTRAINFGSTGVINCDAGGNATIGTLWTTATTAGLSISGTSNATISYSGSTAVTVSPGVCTEAQAISFNFTAGNYALSFLNSAGFSAKNVNLTGYNGTWSTGNVTATIYGSLTLGSGTTTAASIGVVTFGATSGTQLITTNGRTINWPININGAGGIVKLADALIMASTRALTLTNGTFDGDNKTISGAVSFSMVTGSVIAKNISTALAFTHTSGTLTQGANNATGAYTLTAGTLDLGGFTLTTPSFTTAAGTKDLTFNAGTLAVTNATTTAFNNAVPTGFTTTAGTGSGKISMTAATGKTFVGGGSTYNCTLSNDGAGLLTISGNNAISTITSTSGSISITGNNTITTITNAVQPMTYTFTAGTTQTISNWLVGGTVGNLVTIASATAASHTLSKASGIVSSNYLSISRSTATGGAAWYAGANSTNGGNNSGWIFLNAPTAGGAFFSIF
jgi:hypothetical protein